MNQDKSSNPSDDVPSTEDELAPRGTEQFVDRIDGPDGEEVDEDDELDADPSDKGHPPPDDGDNDASSYGYGDPDEVRDEGVKESLGKSPRSPGRDEPEERLPESNRPVMDDFSDER